VITREHVQRFTRIDLDESERFPFEQALTHGTRTVHVGAVIVTGSPSWRPGGTPDWTIVGYGHPIKVDGTPSLNRTSVTLDFADLPEAVQAEVRASLSRQVMPLSPGEWFS
jgi:hypothetical protein